MADGDDIFAEFLSEPLKPAVPTARGESSPGGKPPASLGFAAALMANAAPPSTLTDVLPSPPEVVLTSAQQTTTSSAAPSPAQPSPADTEVASVLMANAAAPPATLSQASSSSSSSSPPPSSAGAGAGKPPLPVQPGSEKGKSHEEALSEVKLVHQTQPINSQLFQFKIDPPQKQSKGGMLDAVYWVYHITAKVGLPQYKARRVEAARRYSDFYFLREQLVKEYRGCIVPKVPPKDLTVLLEKVIHEFNSEHIVAERQRLLLLFLVGVGKHPTLYSSTTFQNFLEMTVEEWAQFVKDHADNTWAAWLQGTAQQLLAPAITDVPTPPSVQPTPNKFSWHWERYRAACMAYEVRKVGEKFQAYNRHRSLLARSMHEVGESLFEFAKLEGPELQGLLRDVAMKSCDTALVSSDQVDIETTKIFECWMYHILQAEATLETLDYILIQRHNYIVLKKQEQETMSQDLASQRKDLEMEVKKAQTILKKELVRVRREWMKDCETILRDFVKYQAATLGQQYKIFVFGNGQAPGAPSNSSLPRR